MQAVAKQTMEMLTLLCLMSLANPLDAYAENRNVEATIESLNDLSMFDEGLSNTGVSSELHDNQHYTIFAPINSSFADIPPSIYPCFYEAPCRPQIAILLRDHILSGRYDLEELADFDKKPQTLGGRSVHVEEPFKGDFKVNGHTILSKAEFNGNIIYRIDGLLATSADLTPFRIAKTEPPALVRSSVTTYVTPLTPDSLAPIPSPGAVDTATQTTTIVQHTVVDPE